MKNKSHRTPTAMTAFRPALLILSLGVAAMPACAQQQPYHPERGSAVRSAIMDGLRAGVRDVHGLNGNVTFTVHKLVVYDDYALTTVTPLNPDGSRTLAQAYAEGMSCDTEIIALLRRTSGRGWRVIERDVGPCDYAWPYIFEQNPDYPAALLREWEHVPDPELILGIRLPTDIPSLVATLGEPSAVELPPEDDPSPWGQWFRWDHEDGAATFSALGDDYSRSTPNRTADVRYIELSSSGEGPPIKTIHGFDLNLTTRAEVESMLPAAIQSSSYRNAVKYQQGGLFTYFFFGPDGHLNSMVQATFDVDYAD